MKAPIEVPNPDDPRHLFAEWADGFALIARHAAGKYYDVTLEHDWICVHIKRLPGKEHQRMIELGWNYSEADKGYVRYG